MNPSSEHERVTCVIEDYVSSDMIPRSHRAHRERNRVVIKRWPSKWPA